ncbi:MAG: DUF2442 domain-containing protein [Pyrinomonadaceae bacterium]|nr:DUF2442 domain-containing protein [Pyrinomonadaceae bacterium]
MADLKSDKFEMDEAEFERQFVEATKRGEKALKEEPRAVAVRYDKRQKRVIIDLNNGATYIFPPALAQGLSEATDEQIADVKVLEPGFALEWTTLDVHFSIKGLLSGIFGNKKWMAGLAENSSNYPAVEKQLQPRRRVA